MSPTQLLKTAMAHTSPALNVLIAEDSAVTYDLLRILLTERGHSVDVVTTGAEAIEAVRTHDYDVALLDFRLPDMKGVEVAAAIRDSPDDHHVPRLMAMTADVEGVLQAEGCESFDGVMPKPLDVYQVGKLVEEQAERAERDVHQPKAVATVAPVRPRLLGELDIDCLVWPDDLQGERFSARAMQASLGDPRFDAILVKQPATREAFAKVWQAKALYLLPVVDLTGSLAWAADLEASKLSVRATNEIGALIGHFHERRGQLHKDLVFTDSLGEKLLARSFVSGRPLRAAYNSAEPQLVTYDTTLGSSAVVREAETLCNEELFQRKFFDRLHVCGTCGSRRLTVREECIKCRSSDLVEEPYLHHFRCAYQGPEADFRRGHAFVCPKCRRELSHFGFDYDRPGTMLRCRACGHAESEPAIGFVCLDCRAHSDAESCQTVDVHSYELTDYGRGFAELGRAFLGHASRALRFAELPLELVVALNAATKRFNEAERPFTLFNIHYENERDVVRAYGARQFSASRTLFLENLRAELGKLGAVYRGQSYDFALLQDVDPLQAIPMLDVLRVDASATLRCDIGAKLQAFGPESFS